MTHEVHVRSSQSVPHPRNYPYYSPGSRRSQEPSRSLPLLIRGTAKTCAAGTSRCAQPYARSRCATPPRQPRRTPPGAPAKEPRKVDEDSLLHLLALSPYPCRPGVGRSNASDATTALDSRDVSAPPPASGPSPCPGNDIARIVLAPVVPVELWCSRVRTFLAPFDLSSTSRWPVPHCSPPALEPAQRPHHALTRQHRASRQASGSCSIGQDQLTTGEGLHILLQWLDDHPVT